MMKAHALQDRRVTCGPEDFFFRDVLVLTKANSESFLLCKAQRQKQRTITHPPRIHAALNQKPKFKVSLLECAAFMFYINQQMLPMQKQNAKKSL